MSPASFEILAHEPTALGMLCLRRRKLLREPGKYITEIMLNDEYLMCSYITYSERALADIALDMHTGTNLRVLVGGLGLGYTAHAALKSEKVREVRVVELLPQVIDWLEGGLVPLSNELNSDERLEVLQGDIFKQLSKQPKTQYDLILIDVDHSPEERLNLERGNKAFYTEAGLEQAKAHLAPGGILAVWSYVESSPFAAALKDVFPEVRVEGITYQNKLVNETHTDWLFFARIR